MGRRKPFLVVVVDHDRHLFNVYGPMNSDREWNHRLVPCRCTGRDVRCFTAREGATRDQIAREYAFQARYELAETCVLDV